MLALEKDPRPADPYRQALEQVGQTTFAPGVTVFLLSAFLLTIGSSSVLELGRAFLSRRAGGVRSGSAELSAAPDVTAPGIFERVVGWNAALLERIRGIEDAIDNRSLVTVFLRPRGQEVLTRLFGVGNEKAYCGRDGWLFYPPDVRHLTGRPFLDERALDVRRRSGRTGERPVRPDPLPAILRFHEQLAARGIALVIVPAPGKATVHPEYFSGRFGGGFAPVENPSFDELKRRLSAEGIRVFDPAPVLLAAARATGRPMFLATDTHWTPEGVRVAAGALARELVGSSILPKAPGPSPWIRRPAVVENVGDVALLLGLPDHESPYRPERVSAERVFSEEGTPFRPDPRADVLVLGDSFSNIFHLEGMKWGTGAGFVEQLAFELGRRVDAILQNDAGSHAAREMLARDLARGEDRLAGKRVVVYEFASRELSEGDWRLVDLPEKGAAAPAGGAVGGRLTGRIASLVEPPRPGETPYPDCYVPLHLVDVSWQRGGGGETDVVTYIWALRDGRATPEAALRAGQTVTLDVVPFAGVASRVEAYRHLEFDNSRLGLLPAYWAGGEETPEARAPAARSLPPTLSTSVVLPAAPVRGPEAFRELVARRAAQAERGGEAVVEGRDGWLFLTAELRHVGTPPAAGGNPAGGDPLDVIAGFARQLAERGVDLLFMPVPPKAVVYPEELPSDEASRGFPRLDARDERIYRTLSARGVDLVDLVPLFLARRLEMPLYARTDSHWSGAGVAIAASAAAAGIRRRAWYPAIPRETFAAEPWSLEITGDLARLLGRPFPGRETLVLSRVTRAGEPVGSRRGSPVLLLGDSHALVYNAGGDLLATGSGLPDHLARELGFPVDLLAVRGSGATPARAALARRGLDGTKLVVWCLSARELTESPWRDVPLPATVR